MDDAAFAGLVFQHAVHRLHRGVREVGELEVSGEDLAGAFECGGAIAFLAGLEAGTG
jgi:hypothetical protein